MKKLFLFLLLLTLGLIIALLPVGIAHYLEQSYREDLQALSEHYPQTKISIDQYQKYYWRSRVTLTIQLPNPPAGTAANKSQKPRITALVLEQDLWHLPWLMDFGRHQSKLIYFQSRENFELPIALIQTREITVKYQEDDYARTLTLSEYFNAKEPTQNRIPFFEDALSSGKNILNTVVTLNAGRELHFKSWLHGDLLPHNAQTEPRISVKSLDVFLDWDPQHRSLQGTLSIQNVSWLDKSLMNQLSSQFFWDFSKPQLQGHTQTRIQDLHYGQAPHDFSIEGIELKQSFFEKNQAIRQDLAIDKISEKQLFDIQELTLKQTLENKQILFHQDIKTITLEPQLSKRKATIVIAPLLLDAALNPLPSLDNLKPDLNGMAQNHLSTLLKSLFDQKTELVVNQFTLGYPSGLFEIQGKIGLLPSKPPLTFDWDAVTSSLSGKFSLTFPKAIFEEFLRNNIEKNWNNEINAKTARGLAYQKLTPEERQAAMDKEMQVTTEKLKKEQQLLEIDAQRYRLQLIIEHGQAFFR